MNQQTFESIQPILALLQQPAFCLHEDGRLFRNRPAEHLTPEDGSQLEQWLGDAANLWHSWDRSGTLELPLTLADCAYTVTVKPLADGILFLLAAGATLDQSETALAKVSQTLRQPLTSLSVLVQLLTRHLEQDENEDRLNEMAGINRQLYRVFRLTGNLADLETLNQKQYAANLRPMYFNAWLEKTLTEAEDLCRSMNRTLTHRLCTKDANIMGDAILLERMFYNLLSNAINFGKPDAPIYCWTERTGTHILFRIRNTCAEDNQELLRSAFTRLDQRDVLPDLQSGMGLGLPLVLAIARLHGGMAAVEVQDAQATVTVSIPLCRVGNTVPLHAPVIEYAGGMRRSMIELADNLPNDLFHPDAL